jgi:hypothetical protein
MIRLRRVALTLVVFSATTTLDACSREPEFALVIRGGSVMDGAGGEAQPADIGIKGDRIVAIGNLSGRSASAAIDATGKIVAPGFIDVKSRLTPVSGLADSHLRQGITTEIVVADKDAFDALDARGTVTNIGALVPLSSPSVDAAMRDGAFGVADDGTANQEALNAAGSVVSRYDGTLMVPVESATVATDAALLELGARTRHIVIEGLSRLPPDGSIASTIGRIVKASQRQLLVYGLLTPSTTTSANEPVIREALRFGSVLIGTGTAAVIAASAPADAPPAAFGAFPRLLGQFVRDEHAIEVREAVRRITSMAAAVFQISERGIIREHYFADVVVFDPGSIADRASIDMPHEYPAGIEYVIVNGVVALTPKGITGSRPGYRLVRQAAAR